MKCYKTFVLLFTATLSTAVLSQELLVSSNDFASIYNNHRFAQPKNVAWAGSYFAYAKHGIAVSLDGESPAAKYDKIFQPAESAEDWEKRHHSCTHLTGATKKGCEAWWGHCNAWGAAGIKESEPRTAINFQGTRLTVADQKAWLTEIWMSSSSYFSGRTNKSLTTSSWVLDSESPSSRERLSIGFGSNYDAFWDVSPKSFFLIFTNHIGIQGQGVVIDRFTGDEVWNQPVVGYRILPIRSDDVLAPETNEAGQTLYPVKIRTKIYWANDNVPEEHLSTVFDIEKTSDSERVENLGGDYTGRYLAFKLFFDKALVLEGDKVSSAGRLIGDGIWSHQENPPSSLKELNQTHPDFIWTPIELDHARYSYANPNINPDNVHSALSGLSSGPIGPREQSTAKSVELSFRRSDFAEGADEAEVKSRLRFILEREGVAHRIFLRDIRIGDSDVRVKIFFSSPASADRVLMLMAEAGLAAL